MKLVYCCDPADLRQPDDAYQAEVTVAQSLQVPYELVSFEALVNDRDAVKAVRRIPPSNPPALALYRGWMLTTEHYELLYAALLSRGLRLINDPMAYRHCHHLPESYAVIAGRSPRSVWLRTRENVSIDAVMELLHPFGSAPVVLKDFVKSRKHEWHDACFIPSAVDRVQVERVVRRFVELQGDDLNEGLVFREFVEFEPLTNHPKSGMPLTKEFRLFFLDGKPVFWTNYWEQGDYEGLTPPVDQFLDVAGQVESRFFTMDVAKRKNGEWMIVELGDGQVAGLPDNADVQQFYRSLLHHWPSQ